MYRISLLTDLGQLYPKHTVFAPRTVMDHIRWVFDEPFRLDTITGGAMVVMGDMPLICSRQVASPRILEFLDQAGLTPPQDLMTFETEAQSVALACECIRRGDKLVYVYPPPAALQADEFLVVPVPLYNWLNDKVNLSSLVDDAYLPCYQIIEPGRLQDLRDVFPGDILFIKACYPGASGAGKDVWYCPDPASRNVALANLDALKDGLSGIRVEKAIDIALSWCLSLSILDEGVRYIGAAIQLFDRPGKQSGSRIDPDQMPPEALVNIARSIALRARDLGFRGVAGFDIGITFEGRPYVFDLNFRIASSTAQILLHDQATARINARISESWNVMIRGELSPALDRIASFAQNGSIVPIRLYEATPASQDRSLITGMMVANTPAEIETLRQAMEGALGALRIA
ncbi:MAG: hypothetical protein R6W75_05680 [Smithellaceae bacterium]